MADKRVKLSDEGEGHRRRDPEKSELEIDAANDSMGGPNTGSLSGGFDPPEPEDRDAVDRER